MDSEDSAIPVWVCREEKLVLGASKRTSCADVVKVLVEDVESKHGVSTAPSYCMVEKWRGLERVVPNTTRILRLWAAWGAERSNVKFVLVKSGACLARSGARSAEARVVLSRPSPSGTRGAARAPVAPEKQRRVVRKAFRKLEKINQKTCAQRMETLVHQVVCHDRTIRQQIHRITELDAEIERCEGKVHSDRVKRHGINYVQDTYVMERDHRCSAEPLAQFEEYVRRCEEVVRLHEGLWEQEALIGGITAQIQEELNRRWTQRRKRELQRRDPEQEERVRTQLDASSHVGLRLSGGYTGC